MEARSARPERSHVDAVQVGDYREHSGSCGTLPQMAYACESRTLQSNHIDDLALCEEAPVPEPKLPSDGDVLPREVRPEEPNRYVRAITR